MGVIKKQGLPYPLQPRLRAALYSLLIYSLINFSHAASRLK